MKILKSSALSSFGGLNFVLEELLDKKNDKILENSLPQLPSQCTYNWKDIFFSYWSIIFCGGDCAEDISGNLKHVFNNSPYLQGPSADRLLDRIKELSTPSTIFRKNRSKVDNEFSLTPEMNELNLKVLNALSGVEKEKGEIVLDKLYVRAKMNSTLCNAINSIDKWEEVIIDGEVKYRGDTVFTPFKDAARRAKRKDLLKEYRLVVTKVKRRDGQLDLFTGEAYIYNAILSDDFEKSNDEVVFFYNQRGKAEIVFNVMKNDFAWNCLPFSKLEQNSVYLILMAICKNIYNYIIGKFSKKYKNLSGNFRIKKFIFRFICIPAKWVKTSRTKKLRIYGDLSLKT